MGSCFSMLIGMKGDINVRTLAELRAIRRIDYLLSRSLIGMVSGLLIFYAFEATIFEGVLFPKLDWSQVVNGQLG
jgi:hypothetical protein